ncbi:hypothetical protein GS580_27325 [Rhodococcus hoagii]|nr:hypothetical protein [Prescottella equi]
MHLSRESFGPHVRCRPSRPRSRGPSPHLIVDDTARLLCEAAGSPSPLDFHLAHPPNRCWQPLGCRPARSAYAEQLLRASGIRQYVVLGAGLDSSAWRVPPSAPCGTSTWPVCSRGVGHSSTAQAPRTSACRWRSTSPLTTRFPCSHTPVCESTSRVRVVARGVDVSRRRRRPEDLHIPRRPRAGIRVGVRPHRSRCAPRSGGQRLRRGRRGGGRRAGRAVALHTTAVELDVCWTRRDGPPPSRSVRPTRPLRGSGIGRTHCGPWSWSDSRTPAAGPGRVRAKRINCGVSIDDGGGSDEGIDRTARGGGGGRRRRRRFRVAALVASDPARPPTS